MSKIFTAQEVHSLVSDVFASGNPNWPVSRMRLEGLRLRQVSDAIKIHVTLVYLSCKNGDTPQFVYEGLKKSWPRLFKMLPVAFTRDETWKEFEHLEPEERSLKVMGRSAQYAVNDKVMNDEELEFLHDESFDSFIVYLEKISDHAENPFDHVLGHLSRGYLYFDDTIPVLQSIA